jgi:hypothetical protein
MAVPTRVPLEHYRGDTLGLIIRLWNDPARTIPTVLTGAAVLAQVRSNPDSEEIIMSFATSISSNQITLTLTPAQTALLEEESSYDVQVDYHSNGVTVQTIIAGPLTAAPDVSRA